MRRGLALDDANTRAHADLGRHLLRTGDEPGARRALERAFKDDPFDQQTYNSLTLLDTLDNVPDHHRRRSDLPLRSQ